MVRQEQEKQACQVEWKNQENPPGQKPQDGKPSHREQQGSCGKDNQQQNTHQAPDKHPSLDAQAGNQGKSPGGQGQGQKEKGQRNSIHGKCCSVSIPSFIK